MITQADLNAANLVGAASQLTPDALYTVILQNAGGLAEADLADELAIVQPDLILLGGTWQRTGDVGGFAAKFAHSPRTTAAGPVFNAVQFYNVGSFNSIKAIYAIPLTLPGATGIAANVGAAVAVAAGTPAGASTGPFGITGAIRTAASNANAALGSVWSVSKWLIALAIAGVALYLYLEYRKRS